MPIDPSLLQQTLDALESIAVITGAGVAIWGLNTWRREMIGRKKAELAEEILAGFYEFEDLMNWVRCPMSYGGEGETRKKAEFEREEQTNIRNSYFVPIERLQNHSDFLSRLRALRYRFLAYFGRDASEPFDILAEVRNDVTRGAHMLVMTAGNENSLRQEEWEALIGWCVNDEDPIKPKIKDAIEKVEALCRPYLMDKKGK